MMDEKCSAQLHRLALVVAGVGIIFTCFTIPAQIKLINSAVGMVLSIVFAIIAGTCWIIALCIETKARGYNPVWGLILIFPPSILIYPFIFVDKNRKSLSESVHDNETDGER